MRLQPFFFRLIKEGRYIYKNSQVLSRWKFSRQAKTHTERKRKVKVFNIISYSEINLAHPPGCRCLCFLFCEVLGKQTSERPVQKYCHFFQDNGVAAVSHTRLPASRFLAPFDVRLYCALPRHSVGLLSIQILLEQKKKKFLKNSFSFELCWGTENNRRSPAMIYDRSLLLPGMPSRARRCCRSLIIIIILFFF